MKGGLQLPQVNRTAFKQLITVKGLTNKSLAEKISVSPCTISNIMNGKTRPCYEVLDGCFHTLELTEEEFITCFFRRKESDKELNQV